MTRLDLINCLNEMERCGVIVFSKRDLEKFFPQEGEKSFEKSLQRMTRDGLLTKAARGIYANTSGVARNPGRVIERVAKSLRPGKLCYLSLESMLSEYGLISQIPMTYLTVMTTGASGVHETPYGTIEFTHTKRSRSDILERSVFVSDRPLRVAKKQAAIQDLVRVGRNLDMIDQEELEEDDE